MRTFIFIVTLWLPACFTSGSPAPPEWDPRIVQGEELLSRSVYLTVDDDIDGASLSVWKSDQGQERGMLLVGSRGALFIDKNRVVHEKVRFHLNNEAKTAVSGMDVVALDVGSDSKTFFVDKGGGWQPVSLFDRKGRQLWSISRIGGNAPLTMAAGDMDRDGKPEFFIGTNDRGFLVDHTGKTIWSVKDNLIHHAEMVDSNGDGLLEIVHGSANREGQARIRDAAGNILNQISLASNFSLCPWPSRDSAPILLSAWEKKIFLQDYSGNIVKRLDAPLTRGKMVTGTLVSLNEKEKPYLAAVVNVRSTWRRSVLYLYAHSGMLVYQEILPVGFAALMAIKDPAGKRELLLVSGGKNVWAYSLRGL